MLAELLPTAFSQSDMPFKVVDALSEKQHAIVELLDADGRAVRTIDYSNDEIVEGKGDLEISFIGKEIRKISFQGMNYTGILGYEDLPTSHVKMQGKETASVFAIDPTGAEFESAVVSFWAEGTELYKCKEYDFNSRHCYGSFEKVMDLTPGRMFSFVLTKEDPLFTQQIGPIQGCSCTNQCTAGTGQSGWCVATCNALCAFNFTIPQNAASGFLSSVHHNVTVTLATTGTGSQGNHSGYLDRDNNPLSGDETLIGVYSQATPGTYVTILRNDAMPQSGPQSFNELNCSWSSGICTWNSYIWTSYYCSGNRRTCTTTMSLTNLNYTWNYTLRTPIVKASAPINNSGSADQPVVFTYNVTDWGNIVNCTLIINGEAVNSTSSPANGSTLYFSRTLSQRSNLWEINCTANATGFPEWRYGSSGLFNYTVNLAPSILSIAADSPVNLLAGSNQTVFCNGTLNDSDYDLVSVNATLFHESVFHGSQDNSSTHYSNASCSTSRSGEMVNFTCAFSLEYYALNGTWQCNATAFDGILAGINSTQTTVNELLAISVGPDVIDYGSLEIMQISPSDETIEITNYGNIQLDVNISAYASQEGDGISMGCTQRNISHDNQRFSSILGQPYLSMTPVSSNLNFDLGLAAKKGGMPDDSKLPLYWKLQIPLMVSGTCNGKLLFTAVPG
jgi:hypothetical protein